MERDPAAPEPGPIDRGSPRKLFSELLASTLRELGARPSPMAVAYLLELLEARILAPEPSAEGSGEPTLAESLLLARLDPSTGRVRKLRDLGDRTLFESGIFGDRLNRSLVDLDYFVAIGRTAYRDLSDCLSRHLGGRSWPSLFRELSDDFSSFVDVLAEVGDRTRSQRGSDLLRIYDRYVRTGSPRDRRRLARQGLVPVPPSVLRRWQ